MKTSFGRIGGVVVVLAMLLWSSSARGGIPAKIIENFEAASNESTPLGITDGNPLAATAVFANSMYRQLGFHLAQPKNLDLSIDASYGNFSSGGVHDGHFATTDLSLGFSFGDRVGLLATIPVGYRDTSGAKVYMGGFGLAVPIVLSEDKFRWTLSPWVLGGFIDGSDLAQGGAQGGGGATSLVSFALAPDHALKLSMANEACYLAGQPFGYNSAFNFEQNVSQIILKNGLELSGELSKSFQAYGSITYTNLMKDAFVDSYWTPEVGVRFRLGHFNAAVEAFGDFGDRYSGYGARATLSLQW